MTWIKTLSEDEVAGPLRQMYEADLARLGFVMEATRALSLKPDVAQAFETFAAAVKAASSLTPQERRPICLAAAATGHPSELHIARLREQGVDDGTVLDVAVWANLRAFGSRIYDALGVQTDPFFLEQEDLLTAVAAPGAGCGQMKIGRRRKPGSLRQVSPGGVGLAIFRVG